MSAASADERPLPRWSQNTTGRDFASTSHASEHSSYVWSKPGPPLHTTSGVPFAAPRTSYQIVTPFAVNVRPAPLGAAGRAAAGAAASVSRASANRMRRMGTSGIGSSATSEPRQDGPAPPERPPGRAARLATPCAPL